MHVIIFCLKCYEQQLIIIVRMNLYELLIPNPTPKPTRHWSLDKSY